MNRQQLRAMSKALFCVLAMAAVAVSQVNAQEGPDEDRGLGMSLTLALNADLFNVTDKKFGSSEIRGPLSQDHTNYQYFINNKDFFTDTVMSLGYTGKNFGGNYSFKGTDVWAAVSGWIQLGFLRFSIGNDITSNYADPLDADPGMRIFSHMLISQDWDSYVETDNVTQDDGILAQAFIKDFDFSLAAGDFLSNVLFTNRIRGTSDDNDYEQIKEGSYRYGARLGYELGSLGKINLTYVLQNRRIGDNYGLKGAGSKEVVAQSADAETFTHTFGAFGSFYLPNEFAVTVGYNGLATAYLNEYYVLTGGGSFQDTGYPFVFRNGANLNIRYKGIPKITLRSDNSFTIWEDKNYDLFETRNTAWVNLNLRTAAQADDFAAISHFVIWNAIGGSYDIADFLSANLYVSNINSVYSVSGKTPTAQGEYSLIRNRTSVDIGVMFRIGQRADVSFSVVLENMTTTRSKDLNAQSSQFFEDYVHNQRPVPVETTDTALTVRIPVCLNVRL